MTQMPRNQHHRPPQEGGAQGRGAVSPLGGRSNPDRNAQQIYEELRNRAQTSRRDAEARNRAGFNHKPPER